MNEVEWLANVRAQAKYSVNVIPLSQLESWELDKEGKFTHSSGRFFSVTCIETKGRIFPILRQDEKGMLGLAMKQFEGKIKLLIQKKIEPGNIHGVQISPTVQATLSNYSNVHQGKRVPYIDVFMNNEPDHGGYPLLEQGEYFINKRNINKITLVKDLEIENSDFEWLNLEDVKKLLQLDNAINMDLRSVLSLIPYHGLNENFILFNCSFTREISSFNISTPLDYYDIDLELNNKINEVSLGRIYNNQSDLIESSGRKVFGIRSKIQNREVTSWDQPILAVNESPSFSSIVCVHNKTLYFLCKVYQEPGVVDTKVIGPAENSNTDQDEWVMKLKSKSEMIHSSKQSEEGGRFYKIISNYHIYYSNNKVETESNDFIWLSYSELYCLNTRKMCLTVELRSLISLLPFTWK